jgi:hypothetical protein
MTRSGAGLGASGPNPGRVCDAETGNQAVQPRLMGSSPLASH